MLDKKDTLDDNELFAIFLYAIQWPDDSNVARYFRETLEKGSTCNFSCYFNYLYNGLKKINPKYLYSEKFLYRRTKGENISVIEEYEKLLAELSSQ